MSSSIELRERSQHNRIRSRNLPAPVASAAHARTGFAASSLPGMKPLVGAMQAWSCVVISVFAIVILSILGILFKNEHHEFVGGEEDPENGGQVAGTIFIAVIIYAGFLVFCGLQGLLHMRESRRGAIAL
ncbi:uncharacterized protein E0L32_004362 [Thyridium curvatum]|uniref:Uncharacterized protein n=1 Tax=Thyridium curvatum TaxID=1093900 RepID=A0A507AZG6_9PEZI|nr:uncharacterized protein E0L32_004362 [Thyridium curvatum]TPX15382.1 hypothetical protein E0L32_004362 [Thyridium curvatum]